MLTHRPILLVPLLASLAWLLGYGLNTIVFGGADVGPMSSRFAHDVVLAVSEAAAWSVV